jgi:NAD(P) transhydrogenase subunit alpha
VVAGEDTVIPTADGRGTVTLVGMKDAASALPADASRLYAKNVANLVELLVKEGAFAPDWEDAVVAGSCLTHDGGVRHAPTAEALAVLAPADSAPAETAREGAN